MGGLIIGRNFASEILGAYFREGLLLGGAYYRNFTVIFKGQCEKLEGNLAKHKKQILFSLAIMPRNPIITVHGDYNAGLLYSPLKIILIDHIRILRIKLKLEVRGGNIITSTYNY